MGTVEKASEGWSGQQIVHRLNPPQEIILRRRNRLGEDSTRFLEPGLWTTSGRHPDARCSLPGAHARQGGLRSDPRSELNQQRSQRLSNVGTRQGRRPVPGSEFPFMTICVGL
jgi:hypothetical protein